MKILIAPDSFKGSMSSVKVSKIMAKGVHEVFPESTTIQVPLSDGGEGLTEAILHAVGGRKIKVRVHDPLMRPITSFFGLTEEGHTAVIEMSAASGIEHLQKDELNPLMTSTYGTGELIKAALNQRCRKIIIGAGGSATVDGGLGAVQALGGRFLDEKGYELLPGGGQLNRLARIDLKWLDKRLGKVKIMVACDVTNPLTGEEGAALVYAPQKGASAEMTAILENNLQHLAHMISKQFHVEVSDMTYGGAAGGLVTGLVTFLGAKAMGGFDLVKKITGLETKMKLADLALTGEGKTDRQTLFGKAPWSLARLATRYHVPVIDFTGWYDLSGKKALEKAFTAIIPIPPHPLTLDEAIRQTEDHLLTSVTSVMKLIKTGAFMSLKKS
ncbi:MAG: glycerate kinase [Bacteroidales bacterium]|nr:glycerate kinase [Bacteroidales bacterium]